MVPSPLDDLVPPITTHVNGIGRGGERRRSQAEKIARDDSHHRH